MRVEIILRNIWEKKDEPLSLENKATQEFLRSEHGHHELEKTIRKNLGLRLRDTVVVEDVEE